MEVARRIICEDMHDSIVPDIVCGAERRVRNALGEETIVSLLNNAATTPAFVSVKKKVVDMLEYYGAHSRGSGPNALETYDKVEEAEHLIKQFIGADSNHVLLFTSNTSEAINSLARLLLPITKNKIIVTSDIEHTSNNLPWREHSMAKIIEAPSNQYGQLDLDAFLKILKKYAGQIAVVTLTGASNMTGYMPPIQKISELVHASGALLFIDAAQLAAHRPINMQTQGIDMLAFSAHKAYAPFGIGVLALPKELLKCTPINPGGGSIDMYNEKDKRIWTSPEQRHQVGSWNSIGIIALGASLSQLKQLGWAKIIQHEKLLINYLVEKLGMIPDVCIHGDLQSYLSGNCTAAIPYTVSRFHYAKVSAYCEAEHAIETRSGTICNHRLVRRWFNISDSKQAEIENRIEKGDLLASYGVVRVSLGIHNTFADIDRLIIALTALCRIGPQFKYKAVTQQGRFVAKS